MTSGEDERRSSRGIPTIYIHPSIYSLAPPPWICQPPSSCLFLLFDFSFNSAILQLLDSTAQLSPKWLHSVPSIPTTLMPVS